MTKAELEEVVVEFNGAEPVVDEELVKLVVAAPVVAELVEAEPVVVIPFVVAEEVIAPEVEVEPVVTVAELLVLATGAGGRRGNYEINFSLNSHFTEVLTAQQN